MIINNYLHSHSCVWIGLQVKEQNRRAMTVVVVIVSTAAKRAGRFYWPVVILRAWCTAAVFIFSRGKCVGVAPRIASRDVTGPASTSGLSYAIVPSCWTGSLTHITSRMPDLGYSSSANAESWWKKRCRSRRTSRSLASCTLMFKGTSWQSLINVNS